MDRKRRFKVSGVGGGRRQLAPAVLALVAAIALPLFSIVPEQGLSADSAAAQTKGKTVFGDVRPMGNGVVWSWVAYGAGGAPSAIGVTFTETALSGLPEHAPPDVPGWDYEVSLPRHVKVPPFDHIVVDWNPRGHIPPGIYDVPHFDFHFYLIGSKERNAIGVTKEDMAKQRKKPPVRYLPAGYILPEGTEEPRMGSHWIDPAAPEFHQRPFTKTFIYGSYNGHVTFYEPMVALAYLKENAENGPEAIKLPVAYERHGFYPAAYRVKYDSVRREYTVSLEALTRQ
ncbi:MAG: DUF5602 domain-containing protein [Verrucomicrobiota bacterium]